MIDLLDIAEGLFSLIGSAFKRFDQMMEKAYPGMRKKVKEKENK
ncbi:MAG: hypothetical protein V1799_21055 [bacterium]